MKSNKAVRLGCRLQRKILWEVVRMKKMFKRAAASVTAAAMAVSMTACGGSGAANATQAADASAAEGSEAAASTIDNKDIQDRCFHLVLHRCT